MTRTIPRLGWSRSSEPTTRVRQAPPLIGFRMQVLAAADVEDGYVSSTHIAVSAIPEVWKVDQNGNATPFATVSAGGSTLDHADPEDRIIGLRRNAKLRKKRGSGRDRPVTKR